MHDRRTSASRRGSSGPGRLAALEILKTLQDTAQESFRALMTAYLLFRLGAGTPPSPKLVQEGLPYWADLSRRLHHTPYGQILALDVEDLRLLVEGI